MLRIILAIFITIHLSITIGRIFHRCYLHPLSKIRGPKLWIAFPILKSIAQLQGRLDFRIRDFVKEYGEVVRIGPQELVFTSAQAWKDIYGHGHAEIPKYFPEGSGVHDGASNIINSNAKDHFRFRRAMLPAFSDKALKEQELLISGYVDLLVKKLKEVATDGRSTNLVKWYTFTTFDLIGDLAYGKPFDGLSEGKPNQWVSNIENMMRLFPILVLAGSSPLISKVLLFFASDKVKKSRTEHLRLTTELTEQRIANKTQIHRGDFMDYIMRAEGKEHGLSHAELVSNSDTLIVAGSETTATLLCGVTYYLLKTPSALQRCVAEVRSAFDHESQIDFASATAKLPYMQACLNEALRLFPPVPTVLFRHVPPGQVCCIDGQQVPEGISVGVHHLATYHSERNFHRAKSFCPERWLPEAMNDNESPFFNDNRDAFKPFSTGPRDCIGRNLAYHEMRLILAKVLWHFDLELDETCQDWAESQRTFALWEKPPLLVRLSKCS